MKSITKPISRGFNLVEIAIVLVIFSLVVAGVLRGQELINSAKARNLIDQKSSFQTAYVAFSNRYKLTAGDLTSGATGQARYIGTNVVASSCGGDGVVNFDSSTGSSASGCPNPESVLVFQNLTAVNLLSCASCLNATSNVDATTANTYINSYSQSLRFGISTASNGTSGGAYWLDPSPATQPQKNILSTGSKVTAAILQQVDQKADDGFPHSGLFRQSSTDSADTTANCAPSTTTSGVTTWAWATNGNANCAGAWLF
jgi:prepilin-type N-terminal cleavage/methylation domain-containing protein